MSTGKDFVANYLTKNHNYSIHKLGYYIRKHIDEIYAHIPLADRRQYYQKYGETLRENIDIDIWNDSCLNRIQSETFLYDNFVISDVRQPHEIDYWTKLGYVPIGIEVDEETRLKRMSERDGGYDADSLNHSTELNAQIIIDAIKENCIDGYIINNSGSVEETESQIEAILEIYKGGK